MSNIGWSFRRWCRGSNPSLRCQWQVKRSFLVKRTLSKQVLTSDQAITEAVLLVRGWGPDSPMLRGHIPRLFHIWKACFHPTPPPLHVRLVLFHFKGKTGHKLLRNFMALSKAQIGSQGKIKLQLLYGKSNGKERLLPEKRGHCLREGKEILWGHRHSSGALE